MTHMKTYTKGFIQLVITALVAVIKQDAPSNGNPYPSGYMPSKYRGNNDMKSIVGHIISDEFYDAKFEGHPPCNLEIMVAVGYSLGYALTDDDRELLCLLEDCHDLASEQMYCNGGDFVEYFLDAVEHNIDKLPAHFKEFI